MGRVPYVSQSEAIIAAAFALGATFGSAVLAQSVFINEIHYDNAGTDTGEAIEIAGPAGTDLTGWRIVRYNGSGGMVYTAPAAAETLAGVIPNQQNGFGTVVVSYPQDGLQNGAPDGIALIDAANAVVQFISYEGTFTAVGGPASGLASTDIGVSESGSAPAGQSLRLVGSGTRYEHFTWAPSAPSSFGMPNPDQTFVAAGDTPPAVATTSPVNGASNVSLHSAIGINFTEPVTAGASAFRVICGGDTIAFTRTGGPQNFVLTPNAALPAVAMCTVTVSGAQVVDQDGAPQSMTADLDFSFTTEATLGACGDPAILIHSIQGAGATTSAEFLGRDVVIEGIVVGAFQGTVRDGISDPQLNGLFVQEEDDQWDADPATSEGIFVFEGNAAVTVPKVQIGDQVRLRGTVVEFASNGSLLTELSSIRGVLVCGGDHPFTRTTIELPIPSLSHWERYEGMAIAIAGGLAVTGNFNLGGFGELDLAPNRLFTPTQVVTPDANALALQDLNDRSRIVLDDGSSLSRASFDPPARLYPEGGLSADNTLRTGDRVNQNASGVVPIEGVLDHRFGAYRIQPTGSIFFGPPDNPRPPTPPAVGGTLRVASFNVLNYFTTIDPDADDNNDPNDPCGPAGGQDCRGADSAAEFTRQRDKIISAIAATNAHIVGLIELQNNPTESLRDLVTGLNAIPGGATYAFVDTGTIGTDAIKVGFIYQPAVVTSTGNFAVLDNSVDPRAIDTQNRPALAQTFQRNGQRPELERVTVVINHFKSKGSDCNTPAPGTSELTDPDTGDGQGNCNLTRISFAQALLDWLATDPTRSGDPDFLIVGDLNSYALEDPIRTLTDASFDPPDPANRPGLFPPNVRATFVDLARRFDGNARYSFQFDGQHGTLDHALASSSLERQVTGVTEWHINSDEPVALDYNLEWIGTLNKNARQVTLLYGTDPFRSSDHDPLVVGLNLLCGDLDDDGDVDADDRARLRASFGKPAAAVDPRMDYDGDGTISLRDYNLWYGCFRQFAPL